MRLPETSCEDRERLILSAVERGDVKYTWSTLTSTCAKHTAEFYVFSDALKLSLDTDDGILDVRVNVSAKTEQLIADTLNCRLLTTKLADLIWTQRTITVVPYPRQITSSTVAMIEHSKKIDAALTGCPDGALVSTVGKHWIVDNDVKPGRAINYGWHFIGQSFQGIKGEVCAGLMKDDHGTYVRLIQGRGWAHDITHVDYSQTCVLVAQACLVDGRPMNLDNVATDPALAPLMNYGGVLKCLRQPGV